MNEVYTKLAERLKYPKSTFLLQILQKIVTPEEGRLLLELPLPTAELAAKLNRSEEALNSSIEDLWRRGLMWVTPEGRSFPSEVWRLQDTVTATEFLDPEVGQLWKDWYEAEWSRDLAKQWIKPQEPVLRLAPTPKALDASRKVSGEPVLPYEDPRQIVEAVDLISLRHYCACRRFMLNCESSLHVCLQFNESAEQDISRHMARKISADEAVDILNLSDEQGLVHLLVNTAKISQIRSICNCCPCCCIVINSVIKHGTLSQVVAKTRYESIVDEKACTGCQLCVDRCDFDAIEMVKPAGSKKYKARIDPEKCWGCGLCYSACKPEAISLNPVRPATHIPASGESWSVL